MKRHGSSSTAEPKRARFVSPTAEERQGSAENDVDEAFLADDITTTSRKEKKRQKGALKDTDGYGSDSSNEEGEGVVPSRNKRKAAETEDDVDMFAEEDDKAEDADADKGNDKEAEFMRLDQIEGQEFGKKTGEDDSDSEAEEVKTGLDGDMGVDITPFNMKAEMEGGRFTADGEEYVENDRDPGDKHDLWLDAVGKDEIKKARRAHREREKVEREREDAEARAIEGQEALMRVAVELMDRGETVLEALQRLGKEAEDKRRRDDAAGKKKSWAEKQRERKAATESSGFAKLNDIVSALTRLEQIDVYSLSRESLQRMLPQPANGAEPRTDSPRPPPDTRQFQYRFSMAYVRNLPEAQRPVEREVFGPFSAQQLNTWKLTGFFGPECVNVEVRVAGEGDGKWGAWSEVIGA
ncbi:hypothetical protein Q5752_000895 [Cryptotrichosporon argae]